MVWGVSIRERGEGGREGERDPAKYTHTRRERGRKHTHTHMCVSTYMYTHTERHTLNTQAADAIEIQRRKTTRSPLFNGKSNG